MGKTMDLYGKTAFITGGSGGLGKAIAQELAARGAHIALFARREGPLEQAKHEIAAACGSATQEISAVSVDLGNAVEVDEAFRGQSRVPDLLYCTAGGNHAENGFFADIPTTALQSCMSNNYFSSAFAAKSVLGIWTEDDKRCSNVVGLVRRERKIVFISSAAAFACLPGSAAYSPAKCAQRALADTLRIELLRECCPQSQYSMHCAFPADFVSPGFIEEQKTKTLLTKQMQGLDKPLAELMTSFPSSEKVATLVIAAVDRGDFIICEDSLSASALFTAMSGPSPKRGLGIADGLLSIIVNWIAWPYLRRKWQGMTKRSGNQTPLRSPPSWKARLSWKLIGSLHRQSTEVRA
ncbi:unnamed protein product [Zymoseptoria tritici ST99CH_1A5]|uniref:Ketoreductase (KR) domain-containing protein n=1 Tax=Zymoseptoria tritici ST99CH_1A5 TaxID=1276529 RepID=A0A1Y6LY89_ZYMTR|nr:unnamed protein product [Zymoseptoria tritici ST99CH_1A5]